MVPRQPPEACSIQDCEFLSLPNYIMYRSVQRGLHSDVEGPCPVFDIAKAMSLACTAATTQSASGHARAPPSAQRCGLPQRPCPVACCKSSAYRTDFLMMHDSIRLSTGGAS